MALHIEISEAAAAELRKNAWKNRLSSVLACVLFMLMGFGIMYGTAVFIVRDVSAFILVYPPPAEDISTRCENIPGKWSSRKTSLSSEVTPTVIVANKASTVSLVPMDIDMSEGLSPDCSPELLPGMGMDLGASLGDSGGGFGCGSADGSALEGTFYDLKQVGKGRSRKASPLAVKGDGGILTINRNRYYEVLANFLSKGWSAAQLSRYYESPNKLYASNFYVPVAKARYAPIAFRVGDAKKPESQWVCQPAGWCVVYRGKVRAPRSGRFRFIGTGDDFLAVRFNRQVVLEGGYRLVSDFDRKAGKPGPRMMLSQKNGREAFFKDIRAGRDNDHKGYELIPTVKGIGIWGQELGGLLAGKEFSVKEGEVYPIEILIAEEGGAFGFVLFIEDTTNGKNSRATQYDIFRTNFSTPSAAEVHKMLEETGSVHGGFKIDIPYNEDSPIWTAVP